MFAQKDFAGEFEADKFRIFDRPQHNKKMRKYLGINHLPVRIVQVAQGFLGRKFIVRTRAIIDTEVEDNGSFVRFVVEGGRWYRAPIAVFNRELGVREPIQKPYVSDDAYLPDEPNPNNSDGLSDTQLMDRAQREHANCTLW